MRIIFVTNNYTPYSGGVVSSITAFAEGLRDLGCSVYIVTLDFKNAPRENHVIRLYCPLKFSYKTNPMAVPWYTAQALESIFLDIQPDIVHAHHPFLLGVAAQSVCKKLHIPLVFTHHSQYDRYLHYIPFSQAVTKPLVNQLVMRFCNKCQLVMVPSRTIEEMLLSHGLKVKSAVLPSPLLPIFCSERRDENKEKLSFQLLYVGRFTQEKNIHRLCDLMVLLGETYKLNLVGYGYYQQEIETYAHQKLKLGREIVKLIQKPPKQEIVQLYQEADLFVFTSQSETQGIVLVEAMAAGVPVVALHGPGQDDIIVPGENGFLVHDINEMKERIEEVRSDSALLNKLRHGAYQTAQNYQQKPVVERLISWYQQL